MKLPNSPLAIVEARKVADYLLNASHPENGGKARFFETAGYGATDVMVLVGALREVAATGKVVHQLDSLHGTKYVVDSKLPNRTTMGGDRAIRTVWIIEIGDDVPRLVTAYPHQG